MDNSGQWTSARRSSSVHSITHIESNQNVTSVRHAPPGAPLGSSSTSTPEEIQAMGVTGLTPLQDAPIYSDPFACTPSELTSLLDLKDLAALEAIGGIESLLRGLGTHPIQGLITRASDHEHDHPSEGRLSAGIGSSRRHRRHPKTKQTSDEPNRLLVEPCPPTPITCNHGCGGCNPYYATLQDRKRVFGTNFLQQHAHKSWLGSMCYRLLYKALIIAMVISLAIIFHDFGMPRTSRVLYVDWIGRMAITITILTVVFGFFKYWQNNQLGVLNVRVVRNGVEHIIDVKEIVVGDIVLLEPGKVIPCDGVFLSGANVKCDESATTDEVDVVKKATFPQCMAQKQSPLQHVADGEVYRSDAGADRIDCFIVSGSRVLEGVGRYVVVAVGMKSLNIRMMVTHRAPAHVLSNQLFKRFFTLLRQPEVLPSIGSVTEQNSLIGLDFDNLATTPNLRGDPPRSSSFIDMDLARRPGDHTPTLHATMMVTSLASHASSLRIHISNSGPGGDLLGSSAVQSQNYLEVLSDDHPPFDTSKADTMDTLRDLAKRASRYCIDLGDRVDRDITEVVRGGSAFVYRGTLHPEGLAVAVKTFRFGHKSGSLLHEVLVWSKLCHRNVLPLLGITAKFDQTVSIVSVWMTLGNAHDYVQNIDVDPRPLIVGIAKGLQYLHNYEPDPIYHGDIKGFNVLISDDGCPLLADFGFSFVDNLSSNMDIEGSRGGTLNWMAPEQLESFECMPLATAQGDVWAFGMTALELFTRQRPFSEVNTLPHLIIRMQRGHPDRPSDEATCFRLTDEWWNICLSCWYSDPLARPHISDILAKFPIDASNE